MYDENKCFFVMNKILVATALLIIVAFTGCRSSREVGKSRETTTLTPSQKETNTVSAQYVKRVKANAQTAQTLTARVKMEINGAGKSLSVSGTLRMKRDDVIQLSLTMLGFEVARMEFSPKEVLLVDRYNKQYVRAAYTDVSFLRQAGLDFNTLQALFWGELFVPGQTSVGTGERFRISASGGHTLLSLTDTPKLEYAFLTATSTACIDRVTVQSNNAATPGKFEWAYADYTTVGGKPFPGRMSCNVTGLKSDAGFTLLLSKIGNNKDWDTHTRLSDKYTERGADELLGKLLGL